jgi:matrixin
MRALRVRTTIAATICAFACGAAPALADPSVDFAPDSAPTRAATEIAKSFWGVTPCAGQVTIAWTSLTGQTNATAMWSNPFGVYAEPSQNFDCQISFNTGMAWDWKRFCSVLVHEYGHLSGHEHSSDPNDVMAPYYSRPIAECVAAAPAQPVAMVSQIASAPAASPQIPAQTQPVKAPKRHTPRKRKAQKRHASPHRKARAKKSGARRHG